MKLQPNDIQFRVQASIDEARSAVQRAKDRAQNAMHRSAQIREIMSRARTARPEIWEAGRKSTALLQLALEDAAHSAYEKDRFLAVVSHELRQPLNAALAALQVLDRSRTDADAARARAVLGRQLDHMRRLVEDLLDLSRTALKTDAGPMHEVDVRRVVEAAAEIAAPAIAAKAQVLTMSLSDAPLLVRGDEPRLVQVISNLLTNAVRYTPPQGRIEIHGYVNSESVCVDVIDTGRGMESSELCRVFEPFARGRESDSEGLGVGLAVVRGIVERHGGSVTAASRGRDLGSRFSVTLPCVSSTTA